ncbi:uncharacterized protein A4U43_C07F11760 [Asparagus officinalis]|uniref:Uncharacterized protein n=1 Tax=Asparagus officinalis TaxID=4686 RepID=A0A5P1EBE1_ASPOF|nr:protein BRANCHLESS TRICHOME-like [Asparagus officinalis]ONK63134.1 uncharacterized protein A4U43_C07F11760 [Asparagus officinalis]
MEEEMEVMMMTPTATMTKSTEKSRNPMAGPTDPPSSPIWKLYDNPHYADRVHRHHHHYSYACITKSRSSYHTRDLGSFSRPMNRDVNLSDLDNALAEIKELRAELEFERRMRRKVDALNRALARELEEERRAREAAGGNAVRAWRRRGRVARTRARDEGWSRTSGAMTFEDLGGGDAGGEGSDEAIGGQICYGGEN